VPKKSKKAARGTERTAVLENRRVDSLDSVSSWECDSNASLGQRGAIRGPECELIFRYGDGSKPWYLVNPKIAGKWMFIPLKMYL